MRHHRRPAQCHRSGQIARLTLLILALAAASASAEIVTGTYTGNGELNRTISGLGIEPVVVIVKGDNAESAIIRSYLMTPGLSTQLAQEALPVSNRIIDFTSDGFRIGNDNDVNDGGKQYYYIAFSADPGALHVGSYIGSGIGSDSYAGLSFTPGMVMFLPTNTARARFVTDAMPAGVSTPFDDQPADVGLVESLDADGFTLSSDWQVNEFGSMYFYVAFANDPSFMTYGSYTGDGTKNRPLAVTGFTPDWVLTKSAESKGGTHLTTELSGLDSSLNFRRSGNFGGGILQLDATGFMIDDNNQVNEDDKTFYWAAFTSDAAHADLGIAVAVDDAAPELGDPVTLTATLRNDGPDDITGGILQVDIPAGLTEQSVTPDAGSTDDQSTPTRIHVTYDIPSGEQRQVVAVYTVDQGAVTRTFDAGVAGSSLPDDNAANDAATLDLTIPTADLSVTISADDTTPDAGGTAELTVDLDNDGPDAASGVTCNVTIPAGLTVTGSTADSGTFDSGTGAWTPAAIASGGSAQLLIDCSVAADQGGQTLSPSVAATSTRNDLDLADTSASQDLTVQAISDLSVALAFDPATASTGDTVDLTVTVTNLGSGDSATMSADVTLPAGLAYQSHVLDDGAYDSGTGVWSLTTPLTAGSSLDLTITALITASDPGALQASASVSGPGADPAPANNAATADLTNAGAFDLAVTTTYDPAAAVAGDTVDLDVAVTNNGPGLVNGFETTITLPAGLAYAGHNTITGAYDSDTGVWTNGAAVPGGATRTLTIQLTVPADASGSHAASAAVTAQPGDTDAGNDSDTASLTLQAQADLQIAAAFTPATADPGDTVDLAITVTNNGPGEAAGFDATVTLPAGLTYQSHAADAGAFDSGTGVWSLASAVAGGTSQVLTITVLVAADEPGDLQATATVTGPDVDAVPGNDTATAGLTSQGAFDLAVAAAFDPPVADAGDTVSLNISVANAGPGDVSGFAATVTLPAGLTYASHTAGSGAYDTGTGIWTDPASVPAGETRDLELRVFSAPDAAGAVSASAALTAQDGDTDPSNDTASGSIDVAPVTDLRVMAAFAPDSLRVGDATTLTVTLTGDGPGTAPGALVDVVLPADLALQDHAADGGIFDAETGRWTLDDPIAVGDAPTLTLDLALESDAAGALAADVSAAAVDAVDPEPANDTAVAGLTVIATSDIGIEAIGSDGDERSLMPGGAVAEVLRIRIVNDGSRPETMTSVTIHNPVTGTADQATHDAYWAAVELTTADGAVLAAGAFVDGVFTFSADLVIPAGDTVELVLRGAASIDAPDGVELRPEINADDIVFDQPVAVSGDWPITAPGTLLINGMTAAQIALHPVDAEVFQMGSIRNLALDFTLPGNGGDDDDLTRLNVVNEGSATAVSMITRVEAWADDGDGLFDASVDARISEMHWTGGMRFEATSLAQPIDGTDGLRVFVTVDIAEDALAGTVQLSLPSGDDTGVGVASGNDGPVDVAVTNPYQQTISSTDKVIVTSASILPRTVAPGESRVPVLHLLARNLYAEPHTLNTLRVRNMSVGDPAATVADLDAAVDQLVLYRDGDRDGQLDGPETDTMVMSTTWLDGVATFEGVRLALAPDAVEHFLVTANLAAIGPADGDSLGAVIGAVGDLQFVENTALVGAWPLDSGARHPIDGMVAAQVACPAVPPVSLTASEGPALALDLTIPGNGYHEDTLNSLRLVNLGSALPADIDTLALYADDGDDLFDPAADTRVGLLTGIDHDWVALDVDLAVPADGRRLFAGLVVTDAPTDSSTVNLAVPVDGLTMASDNDGPRDAVVGCPTSLLISTAPLLSTITFDTDFSTTEMDVQVSMHVTNVGAEGIRGITPRDLAVGGDGAMTVASGPEPASLDLADGEEGIFTWTLHADTAGPVYVSAHCEGISDLGGQARSSLATASATHIVHEPAVDLTLYPVANMPFSINRGQEGVVPLTLTLANDAGEDSADLRLERLLVTLDDGDDDPSPIVPADLLARVTVNEGVNVYCDRTDLETDGQTLTLDLDPPVVITPSEPVTLGLRLDILEQPAVDRFRVSVMTAGDLTAVDAISGLARTVTLADAAFPVQSAAGSIVSQATGLQVLAVDTGAGTAGAGQADVELLTMQLLGVGDDTGSEVKVGGFAVSVTDTTGRRLPDAADRLSRLWVEGPLTAYPKHEMTGPSDSLVVFELVPQITIPVGAQAVPISVHGRLPDDPVLGPLRLQLEDRATFDARDGNVNADVNVDYEPDTVVGPTIRLQAPASELVLAAAAELPTVLPEGASDVPAITLTVAHPGDQTCAAARLDTLRLACLDADRQPQDPAAIIDGYRLIWNGETLDPPTMYQNHHVVIPLGGRVLQPGEEVAVALRLDFEADPPSNSLELVAADTCFVACDANLDTRVALEPAPGQIMPATSGLTYLQDASREVVVAWQDRMPPLLPDDGELVEAARLTLTNPAPDTAAPLDLATLALRARDRNGDALLAGAVLAGAEIRRDGVPWAELTSPDPADSTLSLSGGTPLELAAGEQIELTVMVAAATGHAPDGLCLGLRADDVVCTQPGDDAAVAVRSAAGLAFPFWTAAAGLTAADLESSYINFPNPFAAGRESTGFAFNLPRGAVVSLRIWTARGESVATLMKDRTLAAGLNQDLEWDGRNGRGQVVRNGVYLAELDVQYEDGGHERLLRKVAVVR